MTALHTRPRAPFWLSLVGALAAGALLRLYRLGGQVLLGDELHAVRAVVTVPLPGILVRYAETDVCLPLAGLARLLLDRGWAVSEAVFRAPVAAAGLLLLVAAPLAVRRVAAPGAALVFPWLLALSPGLVLWSRIARSYAPATLLALAAAAAFLAWWRSGRRRWAAAYAVLGALAVWFSLVVAPVVGAPLLFGALRLLGGRGRESREGRPGWGGLVLAGLGLAAGLACFAVPGWESLSEVLAEKPGGGRRRAAAGVLPVLRLLTGSAHPALAAAFWALALRGTVVLARRAPEATLFGAVLVGAQVLALAALPPYGVGHPVILFRYVLVTLPPILLAVAHGFEVPRRARAAGGAAAALFLVLVLVTGPLVEPRLRYSSFVHHEDVVLFHRPLPTLPEERVPAFYRGLFPGAGAEAEPILEYPSYPEAVNRALHLYQDRHRRPVLLATPVPALNDPRLALRNRVPPVPRAILASRARYLVVHRDLEAEELAVEMPPGVARVRTQRQVLLGERFREVAAGFARRLTARWGPAHWQDDQVWVWDLDRVRRRAPPAAAILPPWCAPPAAPPAPTAASSGPSWSSASWWCSTWCSSAG